MRTHYSSRVVGAGCTHSRETLHDAALAGLRKNRGSEAKLSSQLISLLALHVGPGNDEVAKTVNEALKLALAKKALGADAHAAVRARVALVFAATG